MKYCRVLIHCISSQIPGRPRTYLLNVLPLRPSRNRSSYSFSHKDKTRRQKKLRVQTFASCSCFLQQGILKTYELTHYPGHYHALTSLLLLFPGVMFKATVCCKGHWGPYQSSSYITTITFKTYRICSSWKNRGANLRFWPFLQGAQVISSSWFLKQLLVVGQHSF